MGSSPSKTATLIFTGRGKKEAIYKYRNYVKGIVQTTFQGMLRVFEHIIKVNGAQNIFFSSLIIFINLEDHKHIRMIYLGYSEDCKKKRC